MSIITVGIDLAKNVFAVHDVDDNGKAALVKPKVSREHLSALIAPLAHCVIGMEACSGAHHWARQFRQHGHTAKLMAPKFVTPFRMGGKRGKNDAADAAAICEAVTRPAMRFVPVKEGRGWASAKVSLRNTAGRKCSARKEIRPAPGGMNYRNDVKVARTDAIGDHVGQPPNHEFPRVGNPARAAYRRVLAQDIRVLSDTADYLFRGDGIVRGDVVVDFGKIGQCRARPADAHQSSPPYLAKNASTSSSLAKSPLSAAARPRWIFLICAASNFRYSRSAAAASSASLLWLVSARR